MKENIKSQLYANIRIRLNLIIDTEEIIHETELSII